MLLIGAGCRRNERAGSERIDQLIVNKDDVITADHRFLGRIDGFYLHALYKGDVLLVKPALRFHKYLLFRHIRQQGFCEHRAVVGEMLLIGEYRDGTGLIPGPYSPCGFKRRDAAAEDQVFVIRIIGNGSAVTLVRDKVFFSDSADRTHFDG